MKRTKSSNKKNVKKKKQTQSLEEDIRLAAVPLTLIIIFLTLSIINNIIKQQIGNPVPAFADKVPVVPYPVMQTFVAPDISAQSAIVMDDATKAILFAKNTRVRFSMASTTKIMTALVALDYFKRDDILTAQNKYIEGVNVGISPGDQLFFDDLLYGLLLPSGNDIAYTLADNYPGGISAFIEQMNRKAKAIHLTNTRYTDPAGLDDDGGYTTVVDLARLASYAMSNETFARVVGTKKKVITTVDGGKEFAFTNLNKLLGNNGIVGVKTGYTEGAGEVLTTAKIENGRRFIIVVMKSEDRFLDTERLVGLLTNNISFYNPLVDIPQSF